jgi:hypothetical protein
MFGKIASFGAMLALLVSVGSAAAKPSPSQVPSGRCCATARYCCDQPDKAACCKIGTACCDMKDCCGPQKQAAASACPVTDLNRSQCCASKASAMPPCCMSGCNTAGRIVR